MKSITSDNRIESIVGIRSPRNLLTELPLPENDAAVIVETRKRISNIIQGADKRLLVVVGPCSIHNTDAAIEYAINIDWNQKNAGNQTHQSR